MCTMLLPLPDSLVNLTLSTAREGGSLGEGATEGECESARARCAFAHYVVRRRFFALRQCYTHYNRGPLCPMEMERQVWHAK